MATYTVTQVADAGTLISGTTITSSDTFQWPASDPEYVLFYVDCQTDAQTPEPTVTSVATVGDGQAVQNLNIAGVITGASSANLDGQFVFLLNRQYRDPSTFTVSISWATAGTTVATAYWGG